MISVKNVTLTMPSWKVCIISVIPYDEHGISVGKKKTQILHKTSEYTTYNNATTITRRIARFRFVCQP